MSSLKIMANWAWSIPFVIGIIVFIIAIVAYIYNKEPTVPTWIWVMFFVAVVLILVSFMVHAAYRNTYSYRGQYVHAHPTVYDERVHHEEMSVEHTHEPGYEQPSRYPTGYRERVPEGYREQAAPSTYPVQMKPVFQEHPAVVAEDRQYLTSSRREELAPSAYPV